MDNQEFQRDKRYVSGRLKSISYAFRGAVLLVRSEHSVLTQFIIAALMVVAGFYFNISRKEWMLQIMATGLVLAVEGLNTRLEKLCEFVHPAYHEKIGVVKKLSAVAVIFAAIAAICLGLIIYIPRII